MSKATFLQELQRYLQVLEDQELQDILDEYVQHIDIKIQKGLSEEEAIRDFGPVKDLAAEILEAYHVKPDFQQAGPRMKTPDFTKAAENSKKACINAGSFLKQKVASAGNGIKNAWKSFKSAFGSLGDGLKRGWKKLTNRPALGKTEKNKSSDRAKKIWTACGRGVKTMWSGLVTFCKWTLRMIWNGFWLCASGMFGIFALIGLFGFGSMIILRMQGYPLTGIVILCLGALLMFGAVCGACFSLLIRKKSVTTEQEEEEVSYE